MGSFAKGGPVVKVRRSHFPPGPEGDREYSTSYARARRRALGVKAKTSKVGIYRRDYPYTDEGHREYRRAYDNAANQLKRVARAVQRNRGMGLALRKDARRYLMGGRSPERVAMMLEVPVSDILAVQAEIKREVL